MTKADAANEPIRRQFRKFNPGTLRTDQEVLEQFAVRSRELATVLEVLRGNVRSQSCQHCLIVGPRGRGKTMLLARAAAELRTNEELSGQLFPVRFMEENHEIFDMADFWLETLFHLARESASTHPQLALELRGTHASLVERWREQTLGDHTRAAVLDAADRLGRKLVLMVENLQALSNNVDADFGWQLRAVLQAEPQIILLASATSRFKGLDDAEQPFFELFRTIDLKPLTTKQCGQLWQAVTGDSPSERALRPLEVLTGGNPRLLVIVAGFAEHRSLRQLMEELVTLIDEHTEYFRGHLEVLPKSERRVYVAVIDLWRPSSTGEIAARARMNVRVVSTMLGRLVDRGAVIPKPSSSGPKRTYAASEPLYSIYYKLRRERDEAAVVENLIRFMVAFYDPFLLFGIFERLLPEVVKSPALHTGFDRALGRRPSDADSRSRRTWDHLKDLSNKAASHRLADAQVRLQKETDAAFLKEDWLGIIDLVDLYVAEGWDRSEHVNDDHETAYLAHLRADAYLGLGKFRKVIAIGVETASRFRATRDVFILYRSAVVFFREVEAHYRLGDFGDVVDRAGELAAWFGNYNHPDIQQFVAGALVLQAYAESELRHFSSAVSILDEVVARFGESDAPEVQMSVVRALIKKARVVRMEYEDRETAIKVYDEAIERSGKLSLTQIDACVATAFINRAFVLAELGDFDGEIASYQELIDRFRDNDALEVDVALALGFRSMRQAETGRAEDALRGCREIEKRLGKLTRKARSWIAWQRLSALAILRTVQRDAPGAIEAFRSAYGAFAPGNEVTTQGMIRLVLNLIAVGAPERALLEVLSSDGWRSGALAPLVAALNDRCDRSVREPAEVLGVAADISKRIEEAAAKGTLTAF